VIDIRQQCVQMFLDLDYDPFGIKIFTHDNDHAPTLLEQTEELHRRLPVEAKGLSDLVFENVQARARTNVLMNTGFVLGTGDMSELALGWCTYNADHMSMYNVNAGVPKTLVRFLVEWVAEKEAKGLGDTGNSLYHTLRDICDTDISPELLPLADGKIGQKTEDILGPYELHDFFLFHFVRNGFSPEKIAYLAEKATGFSRKYKFEEIVAALQTFVDRFFGQQYKRQAVPDGPKVGSVDLNPRGDWRMPPDATPDLWTRFDQ
jgi:NAD+ synthase (glutamine-hydrolysing)